MSTAESLTNGTAYARERAASAGLAPKRVFDLLVGIPLCLLAIPVITVLAVILAVEHRAFPLFVHDRIGQGEGLLSVPKLRTLPPGHHPYADKITSSVTGSTRLTSFLRRTHLDELPQLFLVPLGRMSLVGPRPRMVPEAEEFGSVEYDARRLTVPQGCTGLWQISVGQVGRVSDHPEYDMYYVREHTVRLDLWILWRTAIQTFGVRPVALADVPRWVTRSPGVALLEQS